MLSTIAEIIRDLLIFVGVITALLIALVVVISKMPDTNPLKRILTALSYRLGATLAAGALAIPLEPIPGIDVLYDIGVPIVLIWYWFTFLRIPLARRQIRPSQLKGKLPLDNPRRMSPLFNGNGSKTALGPAWCRPWALHYIEPVWQLVGRAVGRCMGRKHVTAAFDRGDETGGNVIVVHARCQSINRCLPL